MNTRTVLRLALRVVLVLVAVVLYALAAALYLAAGPAQDDDRDTVGAGH